MVTLAGIEEPDVDSDGNLYCFKASLDQIDPFQILDMSNLAKLWAKDINIKNISGKSRTFPLNEIMMITYRWIRD